MVVRDIEANVKKREHRARSSWSICSSFDVAASTAKITIEMRTHGLRDPSCHVVFTESLDETR